MSPTMKKPEGMEKHSTVSEIARLVGVSPRTVEKWYAEGKIPEPEVRAPNNTKLWSWDQVTEILNWRIAQLSSTRADGLRITKRGGTNG